MCTDSFNDGAEYDERAGASWSVDLWGGVITLLAAATCSTETNQLIGWWTYAEVEDTENMSQTERKGWRVFMRGSVAGNSWKWRKQESCQGKILI